MNKYGKIIQNSVFVYNFLGEFMNVKNSGDSKYMKIRDHYLKKIDDQEFRVGMKIPTETEIAKIWNTSKMTVRRAMQDLVQKGYLIPKRGVGYFISHPILVMETNQITAFSDRQEGDIYTEVLEFTLQTDVADKIIKTFDNKYIKFWYILRLRWMNSVPVQLELTYLPYDLFPNISKEDVQFSKYAYISKIVASPIHVIDSVFSPIQASTEIATALKIKEKDAVIMANSIGYLKNASIFEYVILYHHPIACLLHSQIPYYT